MSDGHCGDGVPTGQRVTAVVALTVLHVLSALLVASCGRVLADEQPVSLQSVVQRPLVAEQQALQDVRRLTAGRVSTVRVPDDLPAWQRMAEHLRAAVLEQVVFRGTAAGWRSAAARVELLDETTVDAAGDGRPGYRLQKLRLEVLPDMWIPAVLYWPQRLEGRVPVFLNVNGHDAAGKAAAYKQTRCIHMARQGIIAMNLEWFGMGQLAVSGFSHGRMNQLDLCGASGLAPFYLALSRALDVLLSLPQADPERVGVAGLSGGGWQTILISALDPRVTLCNPVAGYSSFRTRIDHFSDLGDSEQTPVGLGLTADYSTLTALLAPRAALLTYNDRDDCCFAAGHALPPLMSAAAPAYQLYGQPARLRTHVNSDPGTHNFLVDNRRALYRMIRDQWFDGEDKAFSTDEQPVDAELRTAEQLQVPLPETNLTFQSLAARLAADLPRFAVIPEDPAQRRVWQAALRRQLASVVRVVRQPVLSELVDSHRVGDTLVQRWRLRLGADWLVPLVELSREAAEKSVLVLHDGGRGAAMDQAEGLLAEGYRVFLLDPFLLGELGIAERSYLWALLVSTVGERPLGIQAGQLASVCRWIRENRRATALRLVTDGRRTGLIGLVAAGVYPEAVDAVEQHNALDSLHQVLQENLSFEQAPELFCFGLLEVVDVPQLQALLQR